MVKRRIKIIAVSVALAACTFGPILLTGGDPSPKDNIKVNTSTTQAHVYGRNGYKPGKVDVQFNEEDNTYTVIIQFNPPSDYVG